MKRKVTLAVAASVVALMPVMAQAANKLIVKDATGTTDKFVVTDQGYVGVGTSAPAYPFQIVGSSTSAETTFEVKHVGGGTYNKYTTPTVRFMRNVDVATNGGNLVSGDRVGYFSFGSYYGTVAKIAAAIAVAADGTFSSTSYPGSISLLTTSATDVNPVERLTIVASGNVGIGTLKPKQKLEVNGGVRMSTTTVRPTCDANSRGTLWYTNGGTLATDALEICFKDATDTFSWVKIH